MGPEPAPNRAGTLSDGSGTRAWVSPGSRGRSFARARAWSDCRSPEASWVCWFPLCPACRPCSCRTPTVAGGVDLVTAGGTVAIALGVAFILVGVIVTICAGCSAGQPAAWSVSLSPDSSSTTARWNGSRRLILPAAHVRGQLASSDHLGGADHPSSATRRVPERAGTIPPPTTPII